MADRPDGRHAVAYHNATAAGQGLHGWTDEFRGFADLSQDVALWLTPDIWKQFAASGSPGCYHPPRCDLCLPRYCQVFFTDWFACLCRIKSDDGCCGLVIDIFQVLHVEILLVTPLRTGDMAMPRIDRHQHGVAIRKSTDHAGMAAHFHIHSFYCVVCSDACPVLKRKHCVCQLFFNTVFHHFGGFFQFISRSASTTALAFSNGAALLSCAWIALSILATCFTLERGTTENTLR